MGERNVSHCFSLNGNPANPSINGINGILQEYRQKLPHIALHGPTYFKGILEAFISYTAAMAQTNIYQVLLILTDGVIHDMQQTKELVVSASELPCSIIIVGVGDADFAMMEQLDADERLLRAASGRVAKRDIVQFVEFKECVRKGNLAEEVLREIPDQVVSQMEQAGFKPNRVQANLAQFNDLE